ncbi:VOC family protein [Shinella zoogloeoides]|uniref:VOC family protein n=1 Tax=Shinella zoogloeoides TaxID=352475 RepID=UPI00273F637B|nr:VOC family protein [Shinella zoogloeoides]WLR95348.1 lactoylglutathione lyase [Shinella zoogloeoides]
MPKSIFINLPVKDIKAATAFYEGIGCVKNEQFSDENASSMVWSDTITFQLLQHEYYKTFTTKPIADAHAASGMLIALSRDSREEVDQMVEAAGKGGGQKDVREPQDLGFMYLRSFSDPDGHVFEPAYMDTSAAV